ncbi:MAG: bifunctional folylpolyglutamate synthase/dihydrofolate synthase, partial [Oceanococcaceae bacterium]
MRTLPQWLDWQQRQHPQSIALGLDRVREIYARLQLPSPRRCVTIAGTNGKGTVAHALDALATARSWRTGRYTSPHLYRYNERVCLGGTPVDDATLCDAFEAIESVRGQIPLTFFEYGTLAALWV